MLFLIINLIIFSGLLSIITYMYVNRKNTITIKSILNDNSYELKFNRNVEIPMVKLETSDIKEDYKEKDISKNDNSIQNNQNVNNYTNQDLKNQEKTNENNNIQSNSENLQENNGK